MEIYYPRLIKRVRALLIDGFVIAAGVFAVIFLIPQTPSSPAIKGMLLVLVIASEPLLVAFTGGSVGHHIIGIRVTRSSGSGHINIFASTIRFMVKTLLGWLSLMMVLVTRKHQAIHDLFVDSLVVHKSTEGLPPSEKLSDRTDLSNLLVMPSRTRRIAVTVVYLIGAYLAFAILFVLIPSPDCVHRQTCTSFENARASDLSLLWLVASGGVIVLGYKGLLFGARRKKQMK